MVNEQKGLYVGKIIQGGEDVWEVLSFSDTELKIKILKCGPDKCGHIGSYVDVGREYALFHHIGSTEACDIWEIPSEQMKRSCSQVLLYGFDGNYSQDLDS